MHRKNAYDDGVGGLPSSHGGSPRHGHPQAGGRGLPRIAIAALFLALLAGSSAFYMWESLSMWSTPSRGQQQQPGAVRGGDGGGAAAPPPPPAGGAAARRQSSSGSGDSGEGAASAAAAARAAAKAAAAELAATRKRLEGAVRRNAHVLLVSHDMFMQGSQFFLLRLAMGLRAMGWGRVEFLAPVDGPMRKLLNDQGFFVHLARSLPDWLEEHGPAYSVVHFNTAIMCWAYLMDPAREEPLPGKAFWTIHESKPDGTGLALRSRCPKLDTAFAQAEGVFFVATSTQDVYRAKGWLRDDHTDVIYNGLEVELFDGTLGAMTQANARAALGIPSDAIVIMSAGTLCARKGQLDLARAFVNVLAAYERADPAAAARRPLHLYLVGAERQSWVKKYEDDVEAVAALPAARGRIHVVDRTETAELTRTYYRAADVHALHASDESMPFVCMESMAMGLPQVATRVFGIPELVRDGVDGLIYDYAGNATAELEERLLALATDGEARARLGASAAKRIRDQFTVPKMAARYDAWYMAALTGGARPGAPASEGGEGGG